MLYLLLANLLKYIVKFRHNRLEGRPVFWTAAPACFNQLSHAGVTVTRDCRPSASFHTVTDLRHPLEVWELRERNFATAQFPQDDAKAANANQPKANQTKLVSTYTFFLEKVLIVYLHVNQFASPQILIKVQVGNLLPKEKKWNTYSSICSVKFRTKLLSLLSTDTYFWAYANMSML